MKIWKVRRILFSIYRMLIFASVLEGDTDELPVIIGETEQSLVKIEEIRLVSYPLIWAILTLR